MFIWLTIAHYILYVPGHGSMHLIGLDKMSTHVMGFEPMIKVLSTYILTDKLVDPRLTMPHPIIPSLNAQLVNHQLYHALNAGLPEGLVVDQNWVDLGPKLGRPGCSLSQDHNWKKCNIKILLKL